MSPSEVRDHIKQLFDAALRKTGMVRLWHSRVDTYVSGNPKLKLPNEASAPSDGKTHKIWQPYGMFTNKPATNDLVAAFEDPDDNRTIAGKLVDQSSVNIDANRLAGMEAVEPGTTTTHATANTERSTTSPTYVMVKNFFVSRPGRYRVTFRLSRTAGTTQAVLRLLRPDGVYVDVSSTATYSSTVYPTFGSFTLDMNTTAHWGAQLSIWILNTLGTAQTAYLDSAVVKSQPATAVLTAYDAVIAD